MLRRWFSLTPRARLVAAPGAYHLECAYPLQRFRLNESAWLLLRALQSGAALDEAAPGANAQAVEFLERKVTQGVLAVRYAVRPPARWPPVTVVIPVLNNSAGLERCLQGLSEVDYPPELLSVTVVDDGSRPPLRGAMGAALPGALRVRWVRLEANAGPASARNAALAEPGTGAQVFAFLDSDCRPEPDWLRTLVAVLEEPALGEPGLAAVGGPVLGLVTGRGLTGWQHGGRWLGRYERACSSLVLGGAGGAVGAPHDRYAYLPTCNLAVRAAALRAVGGFTPGLWVGEDVDLCWRLIAAGHGLFYFPGGAESAGGAMRHQFRDRLGPFLRRKLDYGTSEAWLRRRHPARWTASHPTESPRWAFSAALLGGWLACAALWWAGVALAAALLLADAVLHVRRTAPMASSSSGDRPAPRGLTLALALALLRRAAAGLLAEARSLVHRWLALYVLLALGLLLAPVALAAPDSAAVLAWLLGIVALGAAGEWLARRPAVRPWEFVCGYVLDCAAYSAGRILGELRACRTPRCRWAGPPP